MSLPAKANAAAIGGEIPRDAVEERGLAGAVGTDQAHQLAGLDRKVDLIDGSDAEESLGESLDFQDRHG